MMKKSILIAALGLFSLNITAQDAPKEEGFVFTTVKENPIMPLIAGAPAQVARQIGPDLVVGGIWILPEQGDGVHHEAGVAEAALLRPLV